MKTITLTAIAAAILSTSVSAASFSNTYENGMIVANSANPDGFSTVFSCEVANMGNFMTGNDHYVAGKLAGKKAYKDTVEANMKALKADPSAATVSVRKDDKLSWADRKNLRAACTALVNADMMK